MTSEQFTPGPWSVKAGGGGEYHEYIDIVAENGDSIAAMMRDTDEGRLMSRANLIAAAPDLYAACRAIAELRDLAISGVIDPKQLIPVMDYCRAAAIKARGSQ